MHSLNREGFWIMFFSQEVENDYKANRGKPRCALKPDIMKAFDSVCWDFLLHTLQVLGFPFLFLPWIKACLTIPAHSIKINGSSEGFFQGRRGDRQKDVSPCLFVICMEVLSQMLNKIATEGTIKNNPFCTIVPLTHLSFAHIH